MDSNRDPETERRAQPHPDEVCPICGGTLLRIHCTARCNRCHQVIDTCCEGAPPVPSKIETPEDQPPKKP